MSRRYCRPRSTRVSGPTTTHLPPVEAGDVNSSYKEVTAMIGRFIEKHRQDVHIAAITIFMAAFVAVLAIAL